MLEKIIRRIRPRILPFVVAGAIAVSLGCASIRARAQKPNEVTEYALLINGDHKKPDRKDSTELHEKNISLGFSKLREIGYLEKNIITLSSKDPREDKEVKHNYSTASMAALNSAVSYLRNHMDENDILLVYTTGHGHRQNEEIHLELLDKCVESEYFAQRLRRITFGKLIYVGDQCYSGGFVKSLNLDGRNVIAASSTDSNNKTLCKPFARGFWDAVGNPLYDIDQDGHTDVQEAYKAGIGRLKAVLTKKPEQTNGQFEVFGGYNDPSCLRFCQN